MAKTKSGGKTKQQPPRAGKRLGLKLSGGQFVQEGSIIIRQRGAKFHPGSGVGMGRDFTLFSLRKGTVQFKKQLGKKIVCVHG